MFTNAQWLDIAERTGWTFVQAGIGAVVATGLLDASGVPSGTDLKVAGAAAVVAGIKAVVSSFFGTGTASSLPASVSPQPADAPTVGSVPGDDLVP